MESLRFLRFSSRDKRHPSNHQRLVASVRFVRALVAQGDHCIDVISDRTDECRPYERSAGRAVSREGVKKCGIRAHLLESKLRSGEFPCK